jgi:hypothetical protein
MAVDGEAVEEANDAGRWCAHTPCCPKHPLWCSGGMSSQPPRNRWC